MNARANIGYLYNKDYFTGINQTEPGSKEKFFIENLNGKINDIIHFKWNNTDKVLLLSNDENDTINNENGFKLVTTYPGLLSGAGMAHEVNTKGELKLGFYFDYSSGLPVIPGSSVKGVLRSAFPQWKKHIKDTPEEFKKSKTALINSFLTGSEKLSYSENIRENIQAIEDEIFEGEIKGIPLSIYDRDTFLEAVIIKASQYPSTLQRILGSDSITPHIHDGLPYQQSMLKNPVPLPFIKVLPGIEFLFQFDLKERKNQILSRKERIDLFKQILLTLGIGAKTNVGYGQFETVKD